ncbi:MAG: alpha-galactosidase, partial [Pseudomonadota bacterium]
RPRILHWGAPLGDVDPETLVRLSPLQPVHGGPDVPVEASLMNTMGTGWPGPPGLIVHRSGKDWAVDLRVTRIHQSLAGHVEIFCEDKNAGIATTNHISLGRGLHMEETRVLVENRGDTDLEIEWCSPLCLPLPASFTRIRTFSGRWAMEMQTADIDLPHIGSLVRENRAGRTSHDTFPGLLALTDQTGETQGEAAGFHFSWSGNHRWRVDRLTNGQALLQMGELFFPGEMRLEPNETYESPGMVFEWASAGLNAVSQKLQADVRETVRLGATLDKPRPIHFNTWEATYFDHDIDKLKALADAAADVGAERFVLDDGWFGGRRNDRAGLGDWYVSRDVYPDGLHPLVDHVRSLDMEFGLWFEPEMVNPDSDLYRAHPDWVLGVEGVAPVPFRSQLPLDLTNPEVSDYLFERIDALIREYKIDYIKWDMNRDIQHPGSAGRAVAHAQTYAVYDLMARLNLVHCDLEIESCASGGARMDYGVLQQTDRLWLSDSNDAHDRQIIQRGASYFFPPEVLGSHVGPETCHITGRRLSMAFRAGTAMFGHMGLEVDLTKERPDDLETLKAAIALHKQHRALIHSSDAYRLDPIDHHMAFGIVERDKGEALFSFACMETVRHTHPLHIRLTGLGLATTYRLKCIWPSDGLTATQGSVLDTAGLYGDGISVSGRALMEFGLKLPLMRPDSVMVLHLEAV